MALTRANVEFLLVARVGPLLTAAGLAVTVAGANADLNGPIGSALRALDYTVASAVLVADADVAAVTDAETNEFLDLATLFTLEAILENLDDVDLTVGPRSEKFSQLAEQIERRIERLRSILGLDMVTPESQHITLQIAEHG